MNISVIVLIAIALVLVLYFALRRFESLSDRTTDELRDLLHGTDWLFYRNALLELQTGRRHQEGGHAGTQSAHFRDKATTHRGLADSTGTVS